MMTIMSHSLEEGLHRGEIRWRVESDRELEPFGTVPPLRWAADPGTPPDAPRPGLPLPPAARGKYRWALCIIRWQSNLRSVTLRSDAITGIPSERFGTK